MISSDRTVCDLLLTGGSVITVDDRRAVYEPGAVAVSGERIVAVGTPDELDGYRAERVIDCTGQAVLPGFVDSHTHLFQSLGRGLGEGMSLYPWLSDFMWPYARQISREQAWAGIRLTALEARAGRNDRSSRRPLRAGRPGDDGGSGANHRGGVGLRGVVARGIYGAPAEVTRHYDIPDYLFELSPEEETGDYGRGHRSHRRAAGGGLAGA